MKFLFNFFVITLLFGGVFSLNATVKCDNFYKHKPIINVESTTLCYEYFTVEYSNKYRIPLYSAYVVKKDMIEKSSKIGRKDTFHDEPLTNEPTEDTYYKSSYDRGHLAESELFPTYESQYESFSYANMVPQVPNINRGVWKKLEKKIRDMSYKGDVYVITLPIYQYKKILKNTLVPTHLVKVVYTNNTHEIFIVENKKGSKIRTISKEELNLLIKNSIINTLTIKN